MRTYTTEKVCNFLRSKGLSVVKDNGSVRLTRDEICNKIEGETEEDNYSNLLKECNQQFDYRFMYSMKSDDYLWLETVCGE